MLKPAILYKEQLEKLFAEKLYSKEMFFYSGYGGEYFIPEIKAENGKQQYAIIDSNDDVIGFLSYGINIHTGDIYHFGLFGFKNSPRLGKELNDKLEELLEKYKRIEWICVDNNPVLKHYIKFCEDHNGQMIHLHNCLVDEEGITRGRYLFEVMSTKDDE